jgi:RNA polymerase sigma factor (sigma-70 family)
MMLAVRPTVWLAWRRPPAGAKRSAAGEASSSSVDESMRLVALDGERIRPTGEPAMTFEEFFEVESGPLYRRMCLITRDPYEAEEVMQDAFISVFERWERVSEMDDPTGYLYRIAFRTVGRRARRAARAIFRAGQVEESTDEYASSDARNVVRDALARLTRRQRTAIVLTELLGYSSEEAGKMMGARAVTVRVLASQGRAAMRRALEHAHE